MASDSMPYSFKTPDELSPIVELSARPMRPTEMRISEGPSFHVVEIDATLNLIRLLRMASSVQLYMPEMTLRGHRLYPEPSGTKDKTREMIATLAIAM